MRRLRWKLTFSYALVTAAALLAVELAILAYAFAALVPLLRSPDAGLVGSVVNAFSTTTAWQVQPYLDRETPDIDGLRAALAKVGEQLRPGLRPGPSPAGAPQSVARAEDLAGLDLAVMVFDTRYRLLGSIPALPAGEIEPTFSLSLVPGLETGLAAVLSAGQEGIFLPPKPGATHHLHVSAVKGSDGRVLAAVVAFATPGVISAMVPAIITSSLALVGGSLIAFLVLASVAGTVFGFFTARGLSRRLDRLERAAGAWSQGDFSAFVEDRSGDELGRLARTLNSMAQQLQNLLHVRQELAGLRERERLARELHDSVKQQIFAAAMQLGAAEASLDRDPATARLRLQQARESTSQAQHDLASLIQQMHSAGAVEGGLAPALRKYLAAWSSQTGVAVVSALPDEPALAGSTVEQALYRVVQEALANVARHSGAGHVWVDLACKAEELVLHIRDDGHGFDVAAALGQGIGLSSMRERVEALGGTLEIRSASGQGTEVVARCPLVGNQRPMGREEPA